MNLLEGLLLTSPIDIKIQRREFKQMVVGFVGALGAHVLTTGYHALGACMIWSRGLLVIISDRLALVGTCLTCIVCGLLW